MTSFRSEYRYPTVSSALMTLSPNVLNRQFAVLPIAHEPPTTREKVALMLPYLSGPPLRAIWDQLDDLQQKAIAETLHSWNGLFEAHRFRAKYGSAPNWGVREHSWDPPISLATLLIYDGKIPLDLADRLKEFVPVPAPAELTAWNEAPAEVKINSRVEYHPGKTEPITRSVVQRQTEREALHDVGALLRMVAMGKLIVSDKTRYPGSAAMAAIEEILEGGDFYTVEQRLAGGKNGQSVGEIKPFAWPLLLQGGKLAELSGKKLTLTRAGEKAMNSAPSEAIRTIWKSWQKNTLFDELRRVNLIRGQTGAGKRAFTAPSVRRPAIVRVLGQCPVGKWISVDALFQYMQAGTYDFIVTRDPDEIVFGDSGGSNLPLYCLDPWAALQGRYILAFLFEVAATLGLIDVAYVLPHNMRPNDYKESYYTGYFDFLSRYDGLVCFRLNALGAYCLDLTQSYSPAPRQQTANAALRVLPNREIVITAGKLSGSEAMLLETYAERVSDLVWRLHEGKMLTAIENGHDIRELNWLLVSGSASPLPDTVTRFLNEFETKASKLTHRGMAVLIECSDPNLLMLITHDPRTRNLCHSAGDRFIVVPIESESAFRKALRQMGHTLKV